MNEKDLQLEAAMAVRGILRFDRSDGGDGLTLYRPIFARRFGIKGAVLLERIRYFSDFKEGEPFYKFFSPSKHELYVRGDSWVEDLGLTYFEVSAALKKFATKITSGVSKRKVWESSIVIYWTNSDRLTWFKLNYINLARALTDILWEDKGMEVGFSNFPDELGKCIYLENLESEESFSSESLSESPPKKNAGRPDERPATFFEFEKEKSYEVYQDYASQKRNSRKKVALSDPGFPPVGKLVLGILADDGVSATSLTSIQVQLLQQEVMSKDGKDIYPSPEDEFRVFPMQFRTFADNLLQMPWLYKERKGKG
jgi:hypothetical protein